MSAARQLACRLRERLPSEPVGVVEVAESVDWSSITFSGERHRVLVTFAGNEARAAASQFLDGLIDADLPLAGHVLCDIGLLTGSLHDSGTLASLDLEAVTVRDQERLAA